MLILSRKEDEKIRSGNNIVINIISISEGNVKIGIEADKDIKIFREEVYTLIKEQNKQAAGNLSKLYPKDLNTLKINKLKK